MLLMVYLLTLHILLLFLSNHYCQELELPIKIYRANSQFLSQKTKVQTQNTEKIHTRKKRKQKQTQKKRKKERERDKHMIQA